MANVFVDIGIAFTTSRALGHRLYRMMVFDPPPHTHTHTPPTAISIDVGQTAHKIFDTVSFRTQDLALGLSLFGRCRTALANRFCLL